MQHVDTIARAVDTDRLLSDIQKRYPTIRKYPIGCQYFPRRDEFPTRRLFGLFYRIETRLSRGPAEIEDVRRDAQNCAVVLKMAATAADKSIASPRKLRILQ